MADSLYRRILAESFDQLPATLQEFHRGAVKVEGSFDIEHGPGWIRKLVVRLGGLPHAGMGVALQLRIEVRNGREYWHRRFDGKPMESVQWKHRDLLYEVAGPVRFVFQVAADANSLRLEIKRMRFLGIPIPRFLLPNIRAIETGHEDHVEVDVEFGVPWLGKIISYRGQVAVVENAVTTDRCDTPQQSSES